MYNETITREGDMLGRGRSGLRTRTREKIVHDPDSFYLHNGIELRVTSEEWERKVNAKQENNSCFGRLAEDTEHYVFKTRLVVYDSSGFRLPIQLDGRLVRELCVSTMSLTHDNHELPPYVIGYIPKVNEHDCFSETKVFADGGDCPSSLKDLEQIHGNNLLQGFDYHPIAIEKVKNILFSSLASRN